MIVRHVFFSIVCGFYVVGATQMSALALTLPDELTQTDANRGTINLDQSPSKAAQERAQIGNPLWAIPLGSLSITRDRPIFTPSRRPPAPAVISVPRAVQPKIVVRPAEPEHPNLILIGTVVSETEGIGVFMDQTTHGFVRLKTGESHAGWILRSVKTREATLEKAHQVETLSLPAPTARNSGGSAREDPL
jgi:hypothetical protein